MASVTVYGDSFGDGIIAISGDIAEEFVYSDTNSGGDFIAFSDGTVLRIEYDDDWGTWKITPVFNGSARLYIEPDGDTDKATLTGDIRWVVHGVGYRRI